MGTSQISRKGVDLEKGWGVTTLINFACVPKMTIIWCLRYKVQWAKFVVFLGQFLPFYPPNNPKNQTFEEKKKKWKKHIIILHLCTTNDHHMNVWFLRYVAWCAEFFVILDHFVHFYPPKNSENLEKWKKFMEIFLFYSCVQ